MNKKDFLALKLSDGVFILLIKDEMSLFVGILICMSRIYAMLILVKHEKSFYNIEASSSQCP